MKTAKELWDKYKNITPLRMTALSERDNELISEIEKKIEEIQKQLGSDLIVRTAKEQALTEIINLIKET